MHRILGRRSTLDLDVSEEQIDEWLAIDREKRLAIASCNLALYLWDKPLFLKACHEG